MRKGKNLQNTWLSEIALRLNELRKEYYSLEISCRKEKTFEKIDRRYQIESVFQELNIKLDDWKSITITLKGSGLCSDTQREV